MLSKPPAPPSTVPASRAPVSTTNVSWLSGLPVRFVNPVYWSAPTDPAPGPLMTQVVFVAGPTSVWSGPVALIAKTLVNDSVTAPVTAPAAPSTVHVDAGPTTSTALLPPPAPPPSYVIGAPALSMSVTVTGAGLEPAFAC